MREHLKNSWKNIIQLFKTIPLYVMIPFLVCIILMNILSNLTIYQSYYIAIDGGFIVSWIVFLIMDLITIHFGPKATIKLTIFAVIVNLLASAIFALIGLISGLKENAIYCKYFAGTWFILISSSIAFIASGVINALLNFVLGKLFKINPTSKVALATRSYVSTLIGQFIDNLIFSTLTFMVFAPIFWNGFHWTIIQCLTCSALFALIELAMEIIFSPIAYQISKKWTEKNIGKNLNH